MDSINGFLNTSDLNELFFINCFESNNSNTLFKLGTSSGNLGSGSNFNWLLKSEIYLSIVAFSVMFKDFMG